ncbi:conserved hypothetical protein [Rippkaea orientalis PCC 8801]|uniref:Uncharacterized protein n=1 Tax=Rippkaea orientalis (strain PCC 8801 / RF-1) TaxID=41431 RepID=B7JXK7_RIPO1|nr:hypothetical protein [Rippkaea orientalis]ACK64764.1 conserved hypothetical protein [Rippkaea orientalis PCC 8801]
MLHLAQVKQNPTSGDIELQLLARQISRYHWEIIRSEVIVYSVGVGLTHELLVLVDIGEDQQIIQIQEAKDWIIELIENHLNQAKKTSNLLQEEQERIETWRQEITLKSLDLTRRHLELETQKEQIQELEANLKQEKELLEIRQQELKELALHLEREKKRLKALEDV